MTAPATADEAARQQALLQEIVGAGTDAGSARRGVAIYRANAAALAERALAAMYPTLRSLLGEADFRQLVREHWRSHPPERGDIGEWGRALPGWIERHAGLAAWPYLADCARLDALRHACERASDAEFDTVSLLQLDQGDPTALTLRLRPGAALLASSWPVASIFEAHQQPGEAGFSAAREAIAARRAESVWVVRCGWRAEVRRVHGGLERWLRAVLAEQSLASALTAAGPDFDFAAWLAEAVRGQCLQGVVARGG